MLRETAMRGIGRYLIDENFRGEPIHMHISELAPGTASHAPHQHTGYEALYMLEGQATLSLNGRLFTLSSGEAVVFDPQHLHNLSNQSDTLIRYMVVQRP